jgi:hypothetical protein
MLEYLSTYSTGLARITPKSLNILLICTSGASHCTITFLNLGITGSGTSFFWKITLLLCAEYGNHRSTIIACGLLGNGAYLSIITFLGGGGNRLPEIVITF